MSQKNNPHIVWGIRYFDTQTKTFGDRDLALDLSQTSEGDLQDILRILGNKKTEIAKYRKYFKPFDATAINPEDYDYIHNFALPDYYEDENEHPIDEIGIARMLTGNDKPVLAGNPRSVLELGPSQMINVDTWTQKDSDILAHFIQVCGQIQRSTWRASKLCLTEQDNNVKQASLPSLESLIYVSVYFRQLCSTTDKLLVAACNTYCRYVDNRTKKEWIGQEKKAFIKALDAPTFPFQLEEASNRNLLDAFLYGALIIHSVNGIKNQSARELCNRLLINHDRRKIAFCLNTFLKRVLGYISNMAVVIYQDFSYWQNQYGIPKPEVFWHSKLFGNYSTVIEETV